MRIIKELILEIVGELSMEYKGQTLSADDICSIMDDSDPELIKKSLEELTISKTPLLAKSSDGEYSYIGTKEDLNDLGNSDFYDTAESEPKKAPVKSTVSSAVNKEESYGLDIPENLFAGQAPTGDENEIPSPYAVIAFEFSKNKKSITEGMLLKKTGFEASFFKSVVQKMNDDGAITIMSPEEFEDFDEPVYRLTKKTKNYLNHVILTTSINKVKETDSSAPKVEKPTSDPVEPVLTVDISSVNNAKEFMELVILDKMKDGEEYSKHGMAIELSEKYDSTVSKFGSLGKARFASAIEKLFAEGKLKSVTKGKSVRFYLPTDEKVADTDAIAKINDVELQEDKSVKVKVDEAQEAKADTSSEEDNDPELFMYKEPIPVIGSSVKKESEKDHKPVAELAKTKEETSNNGLPNQDHPAHNLAVLIKAGQISGVADIEAISREFQKLLTNISSTLNRDSEVEELKAKLKKFEALKEALNNT